MSKFKIYVFLQCLLFLTLPVLAQVDTGWVRRYNGPANNDDRPSALAVDGSGNVYVTGWSWSSGTSISYATIKYAPNGDTLWLRRYNGPGTVDNRPSALAVDGSGNLYVTGVSYGSGTACDFATIKYAPNGDTLWVRRYNGPYGSDDKAYALAVDGNGSVYVAGYTWYSTYDFATIKYAPNGDTLWVRRYNGPVSDWDTATALAVDGNGNVYVTGSSGGSGGYDYATIKYAPNGDTLWVRRYNGTYGDNDVAFTLAVDGNGNVYVTGASISSETSFFDYVTVKYTPNGDTVWVRRYNGPASADDEAFALAVDGNGNVYVTGWSDIDCWFGCTGGDYATIKYAPNGDTLWIRRYNGPGNGTDIANALAVDKSGNVYVAGQSVAAGSSDDYVTIKYAPNGDTLWVRRYNGPGNASDIAHALAVDDSGNVYVTGESVAGRTGDDYVTIKYNKFGCAAKAGDVNGDYNVKLSDIVLQINYLFKGGAKPDPFCSGDANADGNILLTDIVYLINYIFKSGQAPIKSNECCL